jgi:hypothetical protein
VPEVEARLEALPDRIRDTPRGDARRAAKVSDELRRVLDLVPPVPVEELLGQVRAADAVWRERPAPAAADRLAGLVEDLAVALDAQPATGAQGVLPSASMH